MKKFIMVLVMFQSINSMEYQSNSMPNFSINEAANEWLTNYFVKEEYEQDNIIDYLKVAKKNEKIVQENMQEYPDETVEILRKYFYKHCKNYKIARNPDLIPAIEQFESVSSNKDYLSEISKLLLDQAFTKLSKKFELDMMHPYIEPKDLNTTILTILAMSPFRLNLIRACLRNIKITKAINTMKCMQIEIKKHRNYTMKIKLAALPVSE